MKSLLTKSILMDEAALNRAIRRISHEIIERNNGLDNVCLIGIQFRWQNR